VPTRGLPPDTAGPDPRSGVGGAQRSRARGGGWQTPRRCGRSPTGAAAGGMAGAPTDHGHRLSAPLPSRSRSPPPEASGARHGVFRRPGAGQVLGGALDVDRSAPERRINKIGETAVPGCHCRATPLGSCTSAPRTWGWSGPGFALGRTQNLLPTHVGMDQLPARLGEFSQRPPHACGEPPSRGCERPGLT